MATSTMRAPEEGEQFHYRLGGRFVKGPSKDHPKFGPHLAGKHAKSESHLLQHYDRVLVQYSDYNNSYRNTVRV
jgi:hypothetical protein